MRVLFAAFAVFAALAGGVSAGDGTTHGDLMIKDAWSRATPARNGVAYMTIFNHGQDMDRLITARSPIAKKVGAAYAYHADGVMRMRHIETVKCNRASRCSAPGGNPSC